MGFKNFIKKIIPSFRTKEALQGSINSLKTYFAEFRKSTLDEIYNLNKKIDYFYFALNKQKDELTMDAKKRLFSELPTATGDLRTVQLVNNYLLVKLKEVCDENDIDFFLSGGTMLGAFRHKGFIPWDDDIDVAIFRADLDKLQKILENNKEIRITYKYNYYYNVRTAKVLFRDCDFFFVDVWVWDTVCLNGKTEEDFWKDSQELSIEFHKKLKELSKPYMVDNNPPLRPVENEELENQIKSILDVYLERSSINEMGDYICECIEDPVVFRDEKKLILKKDALPFDYLMFEGNPYKVLRNYEKVLNNMYGDIWNFPKKVDAYHGKELQEGLSEALKILEKKGINF